MPAFVTCGDYITYISILLSSADYWLALLICFPELGGWLWRQRTWNLWCFNVSSLLISSRSLRKFLSKPIVFIWSEKKTRIHVVDVTSNGLSNATTAAHPSHTLFRFSGKKLKSAHLLDFLCKEFLPFLLKVFRSVGGLGDDSARNWPFTFTFAPVPPRLLCWGILLYVLMYMMSRRYTSFYISLAYPQATVRPWDKNSSLRVIVSWDPQTFVLILTEWIFLCLHEKWRGVRSKKKIIRNKTEKGR